MIKLINDWMIKHKTGVIHTHIIPEKHVKDGWLIKRLTVRGQVGGGQAGG